MKSNDQLVVLEKGEILDDLSLDMIIGGIQANQIMGNDCSQCNTCTSANNSNNGDKKQNLISLG